MTGLARWCREDEWVMAVATRGDEVGGRAEEEGGGRRELEPRSRGISISLSKMALSKSSSLERA